MDGKQNSFVRGFNTIMQEGADCFVKIPDTVCRTMRFIQLRHDMNMAIVCAVISGGFSKLTSY